MIAPPLDARSRLFLPVRAWRSARVIPGRDAVEMWVDAQAQTALLFRFEPGCTFCGGLTDLFAHRRRMVCRSCARRMPVG